MCVSVTSKARTDLTCYIEASQARTGVCFTVTSKARADLTCYIES